MRRIGLRWVLLWPLLATISIGFTTLAVFIEHTVRTGQLQSIDDELVRIERRFEPRAGSAAADSAGSVGDLGDQVDTPIRMVVDADATVLRQVSGANPFTTAQLDRLFAHPGVSTVDAAGRYRVRATARADGSMRISALSLESVDESLERLRRHLIVGGLVVFLLVGLVTLWVATRLTRPVTRMSVAANRIAAGEFDVAIDDRSGSREVHGLANDLTLMLERLRESLDESRRLTIEATSRRDDMQRFLADASHEMRTPLTSLKGYTDLYARNMLNEPGHLDRAMERIGNESVRLAELVDSMLQLARGGEATEQRREAVDLHAVLADVVDDLRAGYPEHEIELVLDVSLPWRLCGDRPQLHQAFLNLGTNACEHGGAGGAVEIVVRRDDDNVVVDVVDHGVGIAVDIADDVFLPFFRGDAARARDGRGGAGLGLAITRQIIERHTGSIAVVATFGGGATLRVALPCEDSPS